MGAAKHNIKIDCGSDYDLIFAQTANDVRVPITNVTATMQIRDEFDGSVLINLSSAAGNITFEDVEISDDDTGVIHVLIPAALTEELAVTEATSGVYDIELRSTVGSSVTRVLQGTVKFYPQVTKNG